jgi:signal transduction histidine kinase
VGHPGSTLEALRQMATRDGRIVQEALSNVHRHAAASRVIVDLRQTSDAIILCIADDGYGMPFRSFGPDGSKASLGVGIPGMRIRLHQFGGSLRIRSGKRGTVIRAYVPRCGTIEPADAVPMAAGSQSQPVKAMRQAGSGVPPSIPRDSPEFRE